MVRVLELNPIIVKELRSRMRGGRLYLILTGYLVGLGLVSYAILRVFQSQAENGMQIISAHVGQGLFASLALAETRREDRRTHLAERLRGDGPTRHGAVPSPTADTVPASSLPGTNGGAAEIW